MSASKNPLAIRIGKNLRYLRVDKNLTTVDLAIALNLHPDAISHFENGDRVPCIANLMKYSKYFKCFIDDIITENFTNSF